MLWGDWQDLPKFGQVSDAVLQEILDGGQSFRWKLVDPEKFLWQGVIGNIVLQVQNQTGNSPRYRTLKGETYHKPIYTYFGSETDWQKIINDLPWRSDHELKTCLDTFPGLRILRQPFGETLFSFICSTAKQIPHIKQCCENVAKRFGNQLIEDEHAWPGWQKLAEVSEDELRECKLGYRAKYISAIAQILGKDDDFEGKVEQADYKDAKKILMALPGVGEKVADCVLLFGAGKLEAFPVDTWIIKAMQRIYHLENWDQGKVAQFGRVHLGKHAGLAQQFLFARERKLSV